MNPETLSNLERLQLVNQYRILEKIDPENADHWAECIKILREGYTMFYGTVFDPVWDELSYEDCRYVMNVLDMHDVLRRSFDKLDDKSGIAEHDVEFWGFSGNEESHLLCFAGYLKETGKWETLLKDKKELDSHLPTTWRYRPMLEKWESIGGIERRHSLTKDDIKAIIEEPRIRVRAQEVAKHR
jgi:uncharacterized protein YfbU (UPF0304 family)